MIASCLSDLFSGLTGICFTKVYFYDTSSFPIETKPLCIYYGIIASKCGGITLIVKPEIGFSYKCPSCGGTKLHTFDAFCLSAANRLCVCDCTRSCMHISGHKQDVTAELLCPYCGRIHTYRLSVQELMHNGLCELVCCETQRVCGCAGAPDRVLASVRKKHTPQDHLVADRRSYSDEVSAGPNKSGIDQLLEQSGMEERQVMQLVLSSLCAVEDLLHERRILCPCGSKKYELAFLNGFVQVQCGVCGAYVRLKVADVGDLQKIRTADMIQLTK